MPRLLELPNTLAREYAEQAIGRQGRGQGRGPLDLLSGIDMLDRSFVDGARPDEDNDASDPYRTAPGPGFGPRPGLGPRDFEEEDEEGGGGSPTGRAKAVDSATSRLKDIYTSLRFRDRALDTALELSDVKRKADGAKKEWEAYLDSQAAFSTGREERRAAAAKAYDPMNPFVAREADSDDDDDGAPSAPREFATLYARSIVVQQRWPWTALVDVQTDRNFYRNELEDYFQNDPPPEMIRYELGALESSMANGPDSPARGSGGGGGDSSPPPLGARQYEGGRTGMSERYKLELQRRRDHEKLLRAPGGRSATVLDLAQPALLKTWTLAGLGVQSLGLNNEVAAPEEEKEKPPGLGAGSRAVLAPGTGVGAGHSAWAGQAAAGAEREARQARGKRGVGATPLAVRAMAARALYAEPTHAGARRSSIFNVNITNFVHKYAPGAQARIEEESEGDSDGDDDTFDMDMVPTPKIAAAPAPAPAAKPAPPLQGAKEGVFTRPPLDQRAFEDLAWRDAQTLLKRLRWFSASHEAQQRLRAQQGRGKASQAKWEQNKQKQQQQQQQQGQAGQGGLGGGLGGGGLAQCAGRSASLRELKAAAALRRTAGHEAKVGA
jgi:hypothetical protein